MMDLLFPEMASTYQPPARSSKRQPARWYAPLSRLESRGSQTEVVGGLAGLHEARQKHEGQFFTPASIVEFMWSVAGLDAPEQDGARKWRLLDNSFGSGRMFQFSDPDKHQLFGIEKDAELGRKVQEAVRSAGFEAQLMLGSMEEFRLGNQSLDVALINPPFSIHLDTLHVEPFPCNAFGKHGSKSSTITHKYAVAQALAWCRVVVAVLPLTFAEEVKADAWFSQRLRAVYHLPPGSFEEEGANVDVAVAVWGDEYGDDEPVIVERLTRLRANRRPELFKRGRYWNQDPTLTRVEEGADQPVVTLPVTGDRTVRICHDGRRLSLHFACGAAQGRVMNHVLHERVSGYRSKEEGRLPKDVTFTGQGQLDLENYLYQPDPLASFQKFAEGIAALNCVVQVDPAITNLLRKRLRRLEVLSCPFRHVANVSDGGLQRWLAKQTELRGIVKESFPVWRGSGRYYGSDNDVPVGAELALKRRGDKWDFEYQRKSSSLTNDELLAFLDLPDFQPNANTWTVIHGGLAEAFPERFEEIKQRALRFGLDKWCSWSYQLHDLCEVAMKRGNTVIGFEMGLGKARMALAVCKLGEGRHNLIVVEAHLVREMIREIEVLGIQRDEWQVIDKPAHLTDLRRFNIIAYSRLKMAVDRQHPKMTYAKRLRRRVHTLVADEAHLLRNLKTDQTRAVFAVSPKVRYAMSGTPIANYPRDILPLIQWVAGDGTAAQAYGLHHPFMEEQNLASMGHSVRGIDRFKDMFVTLEWVTNEFADDLRTGAKREIPRIKDVAGFRQLVAPFIKRRVMEEPEVAAHITIPRPLVVSRTIPWDTEHAVYYVKAARAFVEWFKKLRDWDQRSVGLIAILAKMQAVYMAANFPQEGVAGLRPYHGPTSKQRYAVERLCQLTADGHKTIFLAHSPAIVDYMAARLSERGIDAVSFHGGITVANRIAALDDRFRFGDAPVLLATKGVLQTGYNIYQADRVLFYDRSWTPKVEQQAAARVLRPQQTRQVEIEFLELEGSIDTYQAQMVEFKAESMKAGLDFGDEDPTRDFVHIETILGRFVQEFEGVIGRKLDDLIAGGTHA